MRRRRRASTANLIALIIVLLMCLWLLYKLFIGIPSAPPPQVKVAMLVAGIGLPWYSGDPLCLSRAKPRGGLSSPSRGRCRIIATPVAPSGLPRA